MPIFEENEYYAIHIKCIHPGIEVPFDCFIHLKHGNRIIHWVRRHQTFPAEKFNKIINNSIEKIYIRTEDKAAYFAYLDTFLQSEKGKELFQEIQAASDDSQIEGIPLPDEFTLKSLNPEPEKSDNVSVEVQTQDLGELTEKPQAAVELGKIAIEDPQQNLGKVTVKPDLGEFGEVIDLLKNEIQDFENMISVTGGKPDDEERTVIEDCTLKIKDEIMKVNPDAVDEDQAENIIKNVTLKIKDEIVLVRGKASPEKLSRYNDAFNDIEEQIKQITSLPKGKSKTKRLKKFIEKINQKIELIEGEAKKETRAVVSGSVNRILNRLEEKIGRPIMLSSKIGEYDDIPEYLKEQLTIDDFMDSSNKDIQWFQHKIIRQNLLIKKLRAKYQKSTNALKNLKDKWFVFQVQAKKNLSGGDILAAKEIDKEFKDLQMISSDAEMEANGLLNAAKDLTMDMGGENIKIDPQLLTEVGMASESKLQHDNSELNAVSPENSRDHGNAEEASLSDFMNGTHKNGFDEGSDEQRQQIDQLRSENDLIKVQMENLQNLLEVSNKKIIDLEELIGKNNELTSTLEDENMQNRKTIEGLEEQVERLQSAQDLAHDNINDANKDVKVAQADLDNQLEVIQNLKNELHMKDMEIKSFGDSAKLEQLDKAKDERLAEMSKKLQLKIEESASSKKECAKALAKYNQEQQKSKHIGHKLNRMAGQYEALKKQMRSAETKYEMSANALKQARSTIDKLTNTIEDLRRDRQKYIRKTNENLSKYNAMMSKASHLNRQMEADSQNLSDLQTQLKKAKQKQKKLRKEVDHWRAQYTELQKEVAEFKKKAA